MCRLTDLKAKNDRIGLEMMTEAGRFSALADRANNGLKPRAVSAFNLFQTPEEIAREMASLIPQEAREILEPSAGLGRLYRAAQVRCPSANFTLVENNPDCMRELYETGAQLKQSDFLELNDLGVFDAIIMNPPFKMGRDIKHILHARGKLKPGGILISLCYDGVKQNKILKPLVDSWEPLPAGSFKSEGTRAGAVLLTMRRK